MNHKERRKLERQNKFKAHASQAAPKKQAEAEQAKQKHVKQAATPQKEDNEQ